MIEIMKYKQSLTYWGLSGVNAEKSHMLDTVIRYKLILKQLMLPLPLL